MMEPLHSDLISFAGNGTFAASIHASQKLLSLLQHAKCQIEAGDQDAERSALSIVETPARQCLDAVNTNLKEVHKASLSHSKALDRRLKAKTYASIDEAELSSVALLDRAVGLHLLREGQFTVANEFFDETTRSSAPELQRESHLEPTPGSLRAKFLDMYHILSEIRSDHNLGPAMQWTKSRSQSLQARGSNLEFELAQLQFIRLFLDGQVPGQSLFERQRLSIMYAREIFRGFGIRYARDIQQLIGAMAFGADIATSPYVELFHSDTCWDQVALSFTREYCSLLGLSADSPLFIATTAGTLALPMLEKLRLIMKEKRTEWTTEHELPVEIPLPASYRFHSIFVCPVSKEQTTDDNPPMLLTCGHIIAQESLTRLSKLPKFKCPYCPEESQYNDARKVIL